MIVINTPDINDYNAIKEINDLYFNKIMKQEDYESVINNKEDSNDEQFLIAKKNNKITGFLEAIILGDELRINAIGIHPQYIDVGIGTQLIKEAGELGYKKKINTIVVVATKDSIQFYEKLGFEKISKSLYETNVTKLLTK